MGFLTLESFEKKKSVLIETAVESKSTNILSSLDFLSCERITCGRQRGRSQVEPKEVYWKFVKILLWKLLSFPLSSLCKPDHCVVERLLERIHPAALGNCKCQLSRVAEPLINVRLTLRYQSLLCLRSKAPKLGVETGIYHQKWFFYLKKIFCRVLLPVLWVLAKAT